MRRKRRVESVRRAALAVWFLAVGAASSPPLANAQTAGKNSPPPWHGDIRHFEDHDWHVWRGGHWVHGPHAGRPGWWWVVGSSWYFYPAPVYPWPDPYEPPPPWATPVPLPEAPPARFWYWCEESHTYYPYVSRCPSGWMQVPAERAAAKPAPTR